MKSFGGEKKRPAETASETPVKKAAVAGTPSPSAALAEEPPREENSGSHLFRSWPNLPPPGLAQIEGGRREGRMGLAWERGGRRGVGHPKELMKWATQGGGESQTQG